MPIIKLKTIIKAPAQRCFDLSLSIDIHMLSTRHTGEKAVAGTTSGLIKLGETVTWRARHFGIWQNLTTKITELNRPVFFADEMVKGAFKLFRHEHHFDEERNEVTIMTDYFNYQSPLGIFGRLADQLFLERYMKSFLEQRNRLIKEVAESDQWKEILKHR